MRFVKSLLLSAGMLASTAAVALASPLAVFQDPQTPAPQQPTQVEVHTTETHTIWYANPVWIGLGAIIVLLIIILAVMAARGGRDESSTTTVVR